MTYLLLGCAAVSRIAAVRPCALWARALSVLMNDDASPCNAHNFGIQQKKLFQIHPAALFPCAAMPRCRQGDAVRWAAARGRRILTLGEREVVSLLLR